APAPAATPAPRPAAAGGHTLIPNTPLPWALLRGDDADVTLKIALLRLHGQDTRDVALHLVLKGGMLRLDPFSATLPQGHLSATLTADAAKPVPPVALTLSAPGLALASLLKAAGMSGYATGNLEIRADLRGAGISPHAIAASLDGRLGLAMQGGSIDKVALGHLLGGVLAQINALSQGKIGGGGSVSQVRCFALRGNFTNGVGVLNPLLLSSSLLTMDGSGSVSLGPETLDLHLRPQGKVAGTSLVFPVRVTGSLAAPQTALDAVGAAEANAGTVAGAALGAATGLGPLAGLLGADKVLGGPDPCPAALAAARFGAAPAASSQSPATAHPAAKPANNPAKAVGDFLKKLF
ncbi:MAG: AsmA family protein, partial [Rhodospirillales bacterium]|nr:AsmA family protein [Rhodospirillales bacterium]